MKTKDLLYWWACILVAVIIMLILTVAITVPKLVLLDAQRVCESQGWDYAYVNQDGHTYCGADASNETGNGTGIVQAVSLRSVEAVEILENDER